jgi:hypothetical protein
VSFTKKFAVAAAVAMLAAAALQVDSGSSAKHVAAGCTPVSNIEAIIDDSGSMSFTDSQTLRVRAMELLIDQLKSSITVGAVEFGSQADTVFKPEAIGPNAAAMKSALAAKIQADNGSTNYNAAFDLAKADNPGAEARIFLTDGGHNAGDYLNGHRGGPPTYVIGLMIGAAGTSSDADRLQQIASETGGQYYPQQDNSTLQATVNEIGARLSCQSVPAKVQDNFVRPGQSATHALHLSTTTKKVTLTTSWVQGAFSIVRVWVTRGHATVGKSVAVPLKAHPVKLRITRKNGSTYQIVQITNLPRGTLHFKIKPKRLLGPSKVITQILQSSRR